MKETIFESTGPEGRIQVPTSVEEVTKLAGKQGACQQEAV